MAVNEENGILSSHPDRAPLKEVFGGQYNYREGERQVTIPTSPGTYPSFTYLN